MDNNIHDQFHLFVDHKTVEEILETIDDTVLGMSLIHTIQQEISRDPIFTDNRPTVKIK